MVTRRRYRVRIHLIDPHEHVSLPTLEGVLVRKAVREYHLAVPEVQVAPGRPLEPLDSARILVVPRENVAFYEVLR